MLTTLQAIPTTLIPATHNETYLTSYKSNPTAVDSYYMGVKFADLATISDDVNVIKSTVEVAFLLYNDKWSKLYNTLNLEYNPLWNVDATITETRKIDERHHTDNLGRQHGTTEGSQAPFDSSTKRPVNGSEYTNDAVENEHTEDNYEDEIETKRQGNIGVTSSQQLIESERNIADFNFLDVLMCDIINTITYPYYTED